MSIVNEIGKLTDEIDLTIARSIRSAFERDGNAGNSVNSTNNPLQVKVNGSYDLLNMAKTVRGDLEAYAKAKEEAAKKALALAQNDAKAAATTVATDAEAAAAGAQSAVGKLLAGARRDAEAVVTEGEKLVKEGVAEVEKVATDVKDTVEGMVSGQM